MTKNEKYNLQIFESQDLLYKAACNFIIKAAKDSIAKRNRFIIALSGGQTPEKLFALLAQPDYNKQINWQHTFVFWGDERCVPANDPRNNAGNAKALLLDKINIPASNIYPVPVHLSPKEAAIAYGKTINLFFDDHPPRFDLILLGLGENGHTASLFLGTDVLHEKTSGVKEVYVDEQKEYRITMTAPLINKAHQILFLVTGEKKAKTLNKVLTGVYQPENYPAQLINPSDGNLFWFSDMAAASLLPKM